MSTPVFLKEKIVEMEKEIMPSLVMYLVAAKNIRKSIRRKKQNYITGNDRHIDQIWINFIRSLKERNCSKEINDRKLNIDFMRAEDIEID